MDKVEKMDCRAKGEFILGVRELLQADFYEMPSSHSV